MKEKTLIILTSPLWMMAFLLVVIADILLLPAVFLRNKLIEEWYEYFYVIKLINNN